MPGKIKIKISTFSSKPIYPILPQNTHIETGFELFLNEISKLKYVTYFTKESHLKSNQRTEESLTSVHEFNVLKIPQN